MSKAQKKKLKKKARLEAFRKLVEANLANAGDFLLPFEYCQENRIAAVCRVSGTRQKENLRWQIKAIRKATEAKGIKVIKLSAIAENGKGSKSSERPQFFKLVDWCNANKVSLLVVGPTRAFRSKSYNAKNNRDVEPSRQEWEGWRTATKGLRIYTVNKPDASNQEDEDFLRNANPFNGQRKNTSGYKRKLKKALLPEVKFLNSLGHGVSKIAKELCVPHTTIQRWLDAA